MIHWLVQSTNECAGLFDGSIPAGLLSQPEQTRLAALKSDKRRSDWLLGRWTAKHLLQAYVEQHTNTRLPLDAITVANDSNGAPFASITADIRLDNPPELSISHSNDWAFCALSPDNQVQIGADIELIEPRSWRFVEDYFTAEEIERVLAAPAEYHDTLITAIWSAKEAVLKALQLGLTVSTRQVICLPEQNHLETNWFTIDVDCNPNLLRYKNEQLFQITGWWRVMDNYVLTLAAFSKYVTHNS